MRNTKVLANETTKNIIKQLNTLEFQKKTLEMNILQCKAEIMKTLRDNDVIADENDTYLATNKYTLTKHFDFQRFKEDYPDLACEYVKVIECRKLRIC